MAIKVKQSTIDEIKKMGMTKALASAKTRRSPEYQEAIRRMYGERRVKEAMKGAQGGSAPRETYMKRGYSGAPTSPAKKTSAGPKMGGGQGYAGAPKSSKTKSSRGLKVGAGVAATVAAGAAGVYAKGKSVAKKRANMTPAQLRAETQRITKRAQKIAGSKTGKAIGKTARALAPVGRVVKTVAKRNPLGFALTSGGIQKGATQATKAVKKKITDKAKSKAKGK
jgi:hypothetical protein